MSVYLFVCLFVELPEPLFASPLNFPLNKELDPSWCWLVDTHRASGYLLGLILNLRLVSLPVDPMEIRVQKWTQSVLLGNGLQDNYKQGLLLEPVLIRIRG